MAQGDVQAKMDTLTRLLTDPDIRTALEENRGPQTARQSPDASGLGQWEAATRARLAEALAAFPSVPSEVAAAAVRIRENARSTGHSPVLLVILIFVLGSSAAEAAFQKARAGRAGGTYLSAFLPLAVFTITMAVLFFSYQDDLGDRGIDRQSVSSHASPAANMRDTVAERIHSLSGAHDVLTGKEWNIAGFKQVVEQAVQPFNGGRRIRF